MNTKYLKYLKIFAVVAVVLAQFALPMVALAASGGVSGYKTPTPPSDLPGYFSTCLGDNATLCMIKNVINILLAVVFLIAVVYLIIGGFRYIMSQGNEESVEKAKGTITNAIIGIVVVLLAWIIVAAVTSLLNTGATQS